MSAGGELVTYPGPLLILTLFRAIRIRVLFIRVTALRYQQSLSFIMLHPKQPFRYMHREVQVVPFLERQQLCCTQL